MRARCVLVFLVALLVVPLKADTREVTKTTFDGHETIFAQYRQGRKIRTENLGKDDLLRSVTITNFERKMMYVLDLPSQKYVERSFEGPDLIVSLAQLIARPPRARDSGKTVNVYYETIDTGERKQFFGHTAKHLLLRERHIAESGACDFTNEMERDGWYIPSGKAATAQLSFAYGAFTGPSFCQDRVVNHGNASSPGFPVVETRGPMTSEVLELSNDPLDKSLFEVPSGFQKVEALPGYGSMSWSQRLQMEWRELEQAFESWLE